jgi:tetratricopeptide (TPR) repeat protein
VVLRISVLKVLCFIHFIIRFQKGDFKAAIDCYTKGIQCDPANPILPANRAMALLKTGQTAAAEADCTLAIRYCPPSCVEYQLNVGGLFKYP